MWMIKRKKKALLDSFKSQQQIDFGFCQKFLLKIAVNPLKTDSLKIQFQMSAFDNKMTNLLKSLEKLVFFIE
jgi:hypothetical protein